MCQAWRQPADDKTQSVPCRGVEDEIIAVLVTVQRFWRPALINAVLPVVLVFFLGMLVFFTDENDLSTRLEVVVALFLALTGEAGQRPAGRLPPE